MIVAHISIRVVILQREYDSGAHINRRGSGAERATRVQRAAIRVVILQRNKSAESNERIDGEEK